MWRRDVPALVQRGVFPAIQGVSAVCETPVSRPFSLKTDSASILAPSLGNADFADADLFENHGGSAGELETQGADG